MFLFLFSILLVIDYNIDSTILFDCVHRHQLQEQVDVKQFLDDFQSLWTTLRDVTVNNIELAIAAEMPTINLVVDVVCYVITVSGYCVLVVFVLVGMLQTIYAILIANELREIPNYMEPGKYWMSTQLQL